MKNKLFHSIIFIIFLNTISLYSQTMKETAHQSKSEFRYFHSEYKRYIEDYYDTIHGVPKYSKRWRQKKKKTQKAVFLLYKLQNENEMPYLFYKHVEGKLNITPTLFVNPSGSLVERKNARGKTKRKKGITVQEMAKKIAEKGKKVPRIIKVQEKKSNRRKYY